MSTVDRIPTPFSYSSAVVAGEYVFVGLHRGFGATFAEQHEDIFEHLRDTLAHFGLTVADLVKVNVWIRDIKDLPEMEKLFRNHFAKDQYPARMTSTTKFIDADCLVMIDGVAYGPANDA
jgi:2-iminobutanoate/2-iminopropanoate deaminase